METIDILALACVAIGVLAALAVCSEPLFERFLRSKDYHELFLPYMGLAIMAFACWAFALFVFLTRTGML